MKKCRIKYLTLETFAQLTINDVYKHVIQLYQQLLKQKRKIRKLRLKIKKMTFLSKLDAHILKTQAEEEDPNKTSSEKDTATADNNADSNVIDFVNDIKNTAIIKSYEQAGFLFEPESGLYWDSKSGYYYNNEYDLYYDGNAGNWYRLNPITKEFIFHSATEASKAAKKNEIDEEEAIRKILDEGRQPTMANQKSGSSVGGKEKSREENSDRKKVRRSRHSSSDSTSSSADSRRRRRRSRSRSYSRRNRRRSRSRSSRGSRREDGECDTTNSEDERRDIENRDHQWRRKKKKRKGNNYEEIAKKYPPSLRLIVVESKVSKIQVGKLYVVTYKGGTLGREGDHHHVLIPVEEVSKEHLKFTYHNKKSVYQIIEKSRNGTLLNNKQVSLLKQEESEPQTLLHGDTLEIGRVKLLAHIHEGLSTCSECEPFNYTKPQQEQPITKSTSDDLLPPTLSHKEQLKRLQKRYGLESEKYQEKPVGTNNKNYEDRASHRRKKVGSSHDHEKTVQASVNQSISSENKGFKMLAKMGWSEGASIGKSDSGIKEPVQVKAQTNTIGLGHDAAGSSSFATTSGDKKKQQIWSKTQERYNKLKRNDDD